MELPKEKQMRTFKCFPTVIHGFNLDIPIHDKIQMIKYIQNCKSVDLLSQTEDDLYTMSYF